MKNEYRQSVASLIVILTRDSLLCLVFIGFILFIKDILSFFRNSLVLTNNSIILHRGILTLSTTEIPYAKINTVSVKKGILGSLLGYGNIAILSGNDVVGEVFVGIENPDKLRSEILNRTK